MGMNWLDGEFNKTRRVEFLNSRKKIKKENNCQFIFTQTRSCLRLKAERISLNDSR